MLICMAKSQALDNLAMVMVLIQEDQEGMGQIPEDQEDMGQIPEDQEDMELIQIVMARVLPAMVKGPILM